MKGTCYGGVLYLPSHPDSDMHGLLRAIVRTKSWLYCEDLVESVWPSIFKTRSLFDSKLWDVSKSAVEQMVSERHYGAILVCPLSVAYVSPERYQPLAREYFFSARLTGTKPRNPVLKQAK